MASCTLNSTVSFGKSVRGRIQVAWCTACVVGVRDRPGGVTAHAGMVTGIHIFIVGHHLGGVAVVVTLRAAEGALLALLFAGVAFSA